MSDVEMLRVFVERFGEREHKLTLDKLVGALKGIACLDETTRKRNEDVPDLERLGNIDTAMILAKEALGQIA